MELVELGGRSVYLGAETTGAGERANLRVEKLTKEDGRRDLHLSFHDTRVSGPRPPV